MDTKNLFGNELRRLRRVHNLSLADLADAIGCSIVHMSDIERGRRNPPNPSRIAVLLERMGECQKFPEMLLLAVKSRQSIEISVEGQNDDVAIMLLALARRCGDGSLDDNTAREIRAILERGDQG